MAAFQSLLAYSVSLHLCHALDGAVRSHVCSAECLQATKLCYVAHLAARLQAAAQAVGPLHSAVLARGHHCAVVGHGEDVRPWLPHTAFCKLRERGAGVLTPARADLAVGLQDFVVALPVGLLAQVLKHGRKVQQTRLGLLILTQLEPGIRPAADELVVLRRAHARHGTGLLIPCGRGHSNTSARGRSTHAHLVRICILQGEHQCLLRLLLLHRHRLPRVCYSCGLRQLLLQALHKVQACGAAVARGLAILWWRTLLAVLQLALVLQLELQLQLRLGLLLLQVGQLLVGLGSPVYWRPWLLLRRLLRRLGVLQQGRRVRRTVSGRGALLWLCVWLCVQLRLWLRLFVLERDDFGESAWQAWHRRALIVGRDFLQH
mmetsp:Transcript_12005/g.32829  ORF Transcript_12005/g.32829 Transcript_12005/m.32829 type:complete len:375 (-) Transcript_12005:1757-2881(-)